MSSDKHARRDGFKPKVIALSVAACFSLSAAQTLANPTGGAVVSGSASFANSGNTLTITNSANAIINWQNFSIGVNEITRFLQTSGSSAVLNRVVGANGTIPQSVIDGVLSSNGRVFLLNPSGILIGSGARIDVAGFIASSLSLSDQDFQAGRMRFTETPGAGQVSNAGTIDTSSAGPGGRVWLVAPDVQNSGVIRTPQGEIILAAGKSVELVSESSPFVTVNITADSERALNVGQLLADSGRIGMFGALVQQSGVAQANSAVVGANGEIRLVATQNVTLDAGSVTSASGGSQGGAILVSAPVVVQAGNVQADGDAGGNIHIDTNNFLQAGTLSASGSAGPGGTIAVTAPHVIQTESALTSADGHGGDGGSISVDASGASDGLLFSSGTYSATGDKGGNITLLGHDIVLLGAAADASGANGGGTILVGGDSHGNNPAVANAVTTGVNFSTVLKADATQNGDGGKIVVWSDNNTQFYGTASARGGALSGNGGSMEISSGGDHLAMFGFADAGASNGTPGSLLLDPKNIIIDSNAGGTGTLGSFQLVDPHPGASELFGSRVVVLPNQNVVVTDPNDSFGGAAGAGAVYLFNSTTGALTSALTGSSLNDHVGSGAITTLSGGNYLIGSPAWNNGAATGAGAVTFGSGTSGVSGAVSSANSLVGSTANDAVGSGGASLLSNGNYVVLSPNWTNPANGAAGAGAVTAGSGTAGVVGQVSAANSLVGTTTGDNVGNFGITPLANGSYVVISPFWNNGAATHAGAVTFVNSTTGLVGPVSATNSLVGTTANDQVGSFFVTELNNGNYVVLSANWGNGPTAPGAGAVTFGSGTTGVAGAVSSGNSLVGTSTNDQVGIFGVLQFANGNYLVLSPRWSNGPATQAGAVTLINGSNGTIVATGAVGGTVSATNSLVGTSINDQVGESVTVINNSGVPTGYVVNSPSWDTLGGILNVGAVTFGNSAIPVIGAISSANSLVGATANDSVGSGGVVALTNGNYVVSSPNWSNAGVTAAGAVTLGSGTTGLTGTITSANSLVGTTAFDSVGNAGVRPLTNGNYVVLSPSWNNGAAGTAGAVTFGNGTTGITGPASATNSLVGTNLNDQVGSGSITVLTNGNYVVSSPGWNNSAGAATFGNGTTGVVGAVSATNSLVGSTTGDEVGINIVPLFNGNYVVSSPTWSNGAATLAGAVTFGNGTTGVAGTVSAANSLVGTTTGDQVGAFGVTPLLNGNYVVASPDWSNGAATLAGAATFGNGTTGVVGAVSATNSLVGTTANDQVGSGITQLFINGNYVVSSPGWSNNAGAVTFGNGLTGIAGAVSSGNSLVGSTTGPAGDRIGSGRIIELPSGNYLVVNPQWNNSTAGVSSAGAVTWVNGTNGNATGQASPGAVVSASNSLVGGTTNDQVGDSNSCECQSLFLLPNGNFVIRTLNWTNPLTAAANAGAVSFGSGTAGIAGLISSTNSLVGSAPNDSFGSGGILPLTNGNFVVSSPNAANGALAGAGLVQVATPGTGGGGAPATGQTFSSNPSSDVTITPTSITAITNTGTALVLQANNDITLNANSDVTTQASGLGGSITLQAGRSVILNSSLSTDNGAVTVVANESATNGVINANRDPGAAVISMAPGTIIKAGNANISLTLNDGAGLTNSTSGNVTLGSLTTTGTVQVQNSGPTAGSGIVRSDAAQLVSAGSAAFVVNGVGGGGGIGTLSAPIRVNLTNLAAQTQIGGAFFDSPLQGLTIGTAGNLNGITAAGAGGIGVSAAGPITVAQLVSSGTGAVKLASTGVLSESGAGLISTAGTLTTSSSGGTTLAGANTVNVLNATNTTSGDVVFTNAAALTVTGISEANSNVTLSTTGALTLAGAVSAGTGLVTLASTGAIASSGSGSVQGGVVTMNAGGAIGSPGTPLEVITPSLSAVAVNGITIDLNGLAPQPAVVNTLQNTASGDIVLTAHGGATFTSLVSNPAGSVTINSFSPLDVNAGITAGQDILLSTNGGSSALNDMLLAGPYTYNTTSGVFEVTIGVGGGLTLFSGSTPIVLTAPLFPNPINITQFTFVKDTTSIGLDANTVIQATNQLALTNTAPSAEDLAKKDKENKQKKEAVACK